MFFFSFILFCFKHRIPTAMNLLKKGLLGFLKIFVFQNKPQHKICLGVRQSSSSFFFFKKGDCVKVEGCSDV